MAISYRAQCLVVLCFERHCKALLMLSSGHVHPLCTNLHHI